MTDRRNFLKLLPALFVIPALAKQATKPKTQLPPYMLGFNSETDKQLYKIGMQIGGDETKALFKELL